MNTAAFSLEFLGTCACDFSPKLKTELKSHFDNDARRSSSLMLNGTFLIDCGIHTLDSLGIIQKDISEITDIFITHLHGDHFQPQNIAKIAAARNTPLRVWVNEAAKIPDTENTTVIKMNLFQKYEVAENTFITALPANHDPLAAPQHFLMECNGRKLFYGCDGAWLLNQTYNYLKKAKLDIAVLDCTVGDYNGDFRMSEHNSIPMIRLMLPSLLTTEITDSHTEIYLSHIAPSLHRSHAETVEIAKAFGAHVAYDGLKLNI